MKATIANNHSNPTDRLGQSATGGRRVRIAVVALFLCLCVLGVAGCRSAYREGQKLYPSEPCARLSLRIDEAQRAEKRAEKAAATLHKQLTQGVVGQAVEVDIDRLELTTLDFRRRVASARDSAAACEYPEPFEAELQRLEQRATQMLNSLQTVRRPAAPATVGAGGPSTEG